MIQLAEQSPVQQPEAFDVVAAAEQQLSTEAAFHEIVAGIDGAVPPEVKEEVRTVYMSKDPGGGDFGHHG